MTETGGGRSLAELYSLLEAATEFNVRYRLRMPDFRGELKAWLGRYSSVKFRSRREQAGKPRGWVFSQRDHRDLEGETRRLMVSRIEEVAEALTGDTGAWIEESRGDGELLGDYAWEQNDEDGFVPNGMIWMATQAIGGRRVVLSAVLDRGACFIAEAQSGGSPWTFERHWDRTPWGQPRMPRTIEQAEKLTREVASWIAALPEGGD